MNYSVVWTSRFRKDYRMMMKQNRDIGLLDDVIRKLSAGIALPRRCCDHALSGNYACFRECHIQPDWLLIYRLCDETLVLTLTRTGSHSQLFQ